MCTYFKKEIEIKKNNDNYEKIAAFFDNKRTKKYN